MEVAVQEVHVHAWVDSYKLTVLEGLLWSLPPLGFVVQVDQLSFSEAVDLPLAIG